MIKATEGPQQGHTYLVRSGPISIGITYSKQGSHYVTAAVIDDNGQVRSEILRTQADPFRDISVYSLNNQLAAQAEALRSADYLDRESVLSNILKATSSTLPGELEVLLGKPERQEKTPAYRTERYGDYFGQQRARRMCDDRSGPEPPCGDPRILARDSLQFGRNLDFVGKVEYEPPSESTVTSLQDASRMPERQNPAIMPGAMALSQTAYKAISEGSPAAPPMKKER